MDQKAEIINHFSLLNAFPFYTDLNYAKRCKWLIYKLENVKLFPYKVLINLYRDFGPKDVVVFAISNRIRPNTFRKWLNTQKKPICDNQLCKKAVAQFILYKLGIKVKIKSKLYTYTEYNTGTLLPQIISKNHYIDYIPPHLTFRKPLTQVINDVIAKVTSQTRNLFLIDADNILKVFRSFNYLIDYQKQIPEFHFILFSRKFDPMELESAEINKFRRNINSSVVEALTGVHDAADTCLTLFTWNLIQILHSKRLYPTISLLSRDKFVNRLQDQINAFYPKFKVVTDTMMDGSDFILKNILEHSVSIPSLERNIDPTILELIYKEYNVIKANIYQNAVQIIQNIHSLYILNSKSGSNTSLNLTVYNYRLEHSKTVIPLFLRADILNLILYQTKNANKKIIDKIEAKLGLFYPQIRYILRFFRFNHW